MNDEAQRLKEFSRNRLLVVLGRHLRPEEHMMNDDEWVRAIFKRYSAERKAPLIDPAE
jgi:hypothetical protein